MNYRIGSIIEYKTYGGELRRVRVTTRDPDIKNGCAGFDGIILGKTENDFEWAVWGYDDQIIRVVVR